MGNEIHKCKNCEKETGDLGHLCDPVALENA